MLGLREHLDRGWVSFMLHREQGMGAKPTGFDQKPSIRLWE